MYKSLPFLYIEIMSIFFSEAKKWLHYFILELLNRFTPALNQNQLCVAGKLSCTQFKPG